MSQPVAVAIVHGASVRAKGFAEIMMKHLRHGFFRELPAHGRRGQDMLVIKPVYWSSVLEEGERRVWEAVEGSGPLHWLRLRRFVLSFGGDAVAYQPSSSRQQVYAGIHDIMAATLQSLAEEAGQEAPLGVIAHSLGSVIAHNYFYDLTRSSPNHPPASAGPSPLERGDTLSHLYTTGSPLALWSLRYGGDYEPIVFPGAKVSELYPGITPKWVNFYSPSDVLAYPIGSLSSGHSRLVGEGYLEDRRVRVGNLWTFWNPLSHSGYMTNSGVIRSITKDLVATYLQSNPPLSKERASSRS